MPRLLPGMRRALRVVVTVLVAAVLAVAALPFTPEPLFAPPQQAACWFEPLDLCDTGGAASARLADVPVLPAAAVRMTPDCRCMPAFSAGPGRLPEGFAPPVKRPPRRLS